MTQPVDALDLADLNEHLDRLETARAAYQALPHATRCPGHGAPDEWGAWVDAVGDTRELIDGLTKRLEEYGATWDLGLGLARTRLTEAQTTLDTHDPDAESEPKEQSQEPT